MMTTFTVEAIFENGVLRPVGPVPLGAGQRVTLQVTEASAPWPSDVAEIYQELADEDRRLADQMAEGLRQTWPRDEPGAVP
jgi:predicted DNA-binding antitoxin AbrB/MazE fold protein